MCTVHFCVLASSGTMVIFSNGSFMSSFSSCEGQRGSRAGKVLVRLAPTLYPRLVRH